jgi:GNAT superfamily N-acetyltransferase
LFVLDWPPHPQHPLDARRGYVLNVYVAPEGRGLGLAKRLMEIVENEAGKMGIEYAVLHASPMGMPVYEGIGWKGTNEMAKSLVGRAGTAADSVR